jgi:hypothetical protein
MFFVTDISTTLFCTLVQKSGNMLMDTTISVQRIMEKDFPFLC